MSTRWEYIIDERVLGAKYALDEYQYLRDKGDRSWELVAVVEGPTDAYGTRRYYFKRKIAP